MPPTSDDPPQQAYDNVIQEEKFSLSARDALSPDPGKEDMFYVDNNKLSYTPGQLSKLLNPKSHNALYALGGIDGVEKGLKTDRSAGLNTDETTITNAVSFKDVAHPDAVSDALAMPPAPPPPAKDAKGSKKTQTGLSQAHGHGPTPDSRFYDRLRIYSENRLPHKPPKTIFQLLWANYNDKVLMLLTVAAVVSLALGIYQTVAGDHDPDEPKVEWVEGVAIVVAILIVVVVGTVNDFKMERQFRKLNQKNDDRSVKVTRNGKPQEISIYDIVVGDVVHLTPGDMIPVDGLFIEGHNVKCDESSATGESDLLKKMPASQVYKAILDGSTNVHKLDCFIISGSKVQEGTGTFLCTAVGVNSCYGRISMSLRQEQGPTPLQVKLNGLADRIAKYGGSAALLLFIVLLIKWGVQLPGSTKTTPSGAQRPYTGGEKGQQFLQILITAITLVVVAVPEGLPLAVTLALSFATKRMLKDNNLVRVLRAVETGGNATTICSDKTGTLTTNRMTVIAATIGKNTRFQASPGASDNEKNASGQSSSSAEMSPADFVSSLGTGTKGMVIEANAVNSTAFEAEEDGKKTFVGNKTETALLEFCKNHLQAGPVHEARANASVAQVVPFDSAVKYMATVLRLPNGKFRAYVKGASEIVLSKCNNVIADPSSPDVTPGPMDAAERETLSQVITSYASQSLRVIGVSYRDFESWPPANHVDPDDSECAIFNNVHEDMTLVGLFGIKDPLRPGVADAVAKCQHAGIIVRMVTGDNILTASAIAKECGILKDGEPGIAIEGPKFRRLVGEELKETCSKLRVMARSSPDDKLLLVQTLKGMGETVTVTGDGTNDGPALKGADVGFSMGIAGTEVAKEASAIVLLDDNFVSVVRAVEWGRTVNDAVKKFLQFQLTVNITAVVLTFVSSVASDTQESVLRAVQLLWVNLIMDTLAALALATDPPSPHVLNRPPERKNAPLITRTMGKMIIGQAIFQLIITLILNFAGPTDSFARILGTKNDDPERQQKELSSLIFNTFVWMQIFNELNNRRLDNKLNIFEGISKNMLFIVINILMVAGQILIVFVGGEAFKIVPLDGRQWAISVVLGFLSLPVGVLIRLIPDEVAAKFVPRPLINLLKKLSPKRLFKKKKSRAVVEEDKSDSGESSTSSDEDHDLRVTRFVRGGRVSTFSSQVYEPKRERAKKKLKQFVKGDKSVKADSINGDRTFQQISPS